MLGHYVVRHLKYTDKNKTVKETDIVSSSSLIHCNNWFFNQNQQKGGKCRRYFTDVLKVYWRPVLKGSHKSNWLTWRKSKGCLSSTYFISLRRISMGYVFKFLQLMFFYKNFYLISFVNLHITIFCASTRKIINVGVFTDIISTLSFLFKIGMEDPFSLNIGNWGKRIPITHVLRSLQSTCCESFCCSFLFLKLL